MIISTTTSHILCHLSYLSCGYNSFIIITLHWSILNQLCFIRYERTLIIIISICWLRWNCISLQTMMMMMMMMMRIVIVILQHRYITLSNQTLFECSTGNPTPLRFSISFRSTLALAVIVIPNCFTSSSERQFWRVRPSTSLCLNTSMYMLRLSDSKRCFTSNSVNSSRGFWIWDDDNSMGYSSTSSVVQIHGYIG